MPRVIGACGLAIASMATREVVNASAVAGSSPDSWGNDWPLTVSAWSGLVLQFSSGKRSAIASPVNCATQPAGLSKKRMAVNCG